MIVTATLTQLVKLEARKFKGSNGKDVSYTAFKLHDGEGNIFDGPTSRDFDLDETAVGKTGTAQLEFSIGEKAGKNVVKCRLLSFKPV